MNDCSEFQMANLWCDDFGQVYISASDGKAKVRSIGLRSSAGRNAHNYKEEKIKRAEASTPSAAILPVCPPKKHHEEWHLPVSSNLDEMLKPDFFFAGGGCGGRQWVTTGHRVDAHSRKHTVLSIICLKPYRA